MSRSIITSLLAAGVVAQTDFATAGYEDVGCAEIDLAEFAFSPAFFNDFPRKYANTVKYTAVDETRCDMQHLDNETESGFCGGGGFGGDPTVFNLYQETDAAGDADGEEDCPYGEEEEEEDGEPAVSEEPDGCPPGVVCPFRMKPAKCPNGGCEEGVHPSTTTSHNCPSGDRAPPERPPACDGDCKSGEGHVKVNETSTCEECETSDEDIKAVTPACGGKHCAVMNPPACEGEGCDEHTKATTPDACEGEHFQTRNEHVESATPICEDEPCEAGNESTKVTTPTASEDEYCSASEEDASPASLGEGYSNKVETQKPTKTPAGRNENCVDSGCNYVIVSEAVETITSSVLSAVVAAVILVYIL
ncbi:hypothetical protein AK830_g12413 [Neonectria ditissima]|uniref:Uncharacterized protein n=1 Tax=Neonectria ditissima TaxID=78410 RepID=A0A0P7AKA0_9HYPO|nr:hypothetical protein AK830_g12413 [Neonectria ditissima]